MPAINPVPPHILKDVLLEAGWYVHDEDAYNWVLVKVGIPLAVPKRGRVVSLEILEKSLERANLPPGDFFDLLAKIGYSYHDDC